MPALRDLPVVAAPALTAAQMAEVDRAAAEEYAIPLEILMENASRGVALAARAFLDGSVAKRRIVALAGPGNNGGDALAAARHLRNWGADVTCVLAQPADRLRPLARRQFEMLAAVRARFSDPAAATFGGADLLLDGLLGYSVSGPPRGQVASLIQS